MTYFILPHHFLLSTMLTCFAQADLAGEVMNMSELNPGFNAQKHHIFECPDGKNCEFGNLNREPTCIERRRMTGLDLNGTDKYVTQAAEIGRNIQLECHYCNENDDNSVPRIWFYYEKFLASKRYKEVPLHVSYPEEARKFIIDLDHRLTIRNFTEDDGGLYFCQGINEISPKFVFLVDSVGDSSEAEPLRGTHEAYLKYYEGTVRPLNKKLKEEYKDDLKKWFSMKSSVHNYNVSHKWTQWGKCHSCGREKGVRMRTGTCQLSIPTLNFQPIGRKRGGAMNFGYTFSCRSTMLKRFLTSKLRQKVNDILDFIEEMPCDGECTLAGLSSENTAVLLGSAQAKAGEQGGPALLNVVGTIGEPLTLFCSDDPAADVVWLKNNEILLVRPKSRLTKSLSYTKNRGGLFFPLLNSSDAGSYTCIFDDVLKMVFNVDTQDPVTDPPIPETWIWMHLGSFSIFSFLIWIMLIICISRVTSRIQAKYQPLSEEEETFLTRKHELMEGEEDSSQSTVDV